VHRRRDVAREFFQRQPSDRRRPNGIVAPELHHVLALDQADRPLHVTLPYCREDNTRRSITSNALLITPINGTDTAAVRAA
jgi:hypothetical protein